MNHALFRSTCTAVALAASLAAAPSAQAVVPTGTLSFVMPSGVVGANDVIELRMRFTLDAGSVPLNFSSDPLAGIDAGDLPTEGSYYDPGTQQFVTSTFTSYTSAYLNTFFGCGGTFTDSCITGSNYNFDFWTSSTPGSPSINFLDSFMLAPGASTDYLFGTFTPAAGGAAPGTYAFYSTGLTLNVIGFDVNGNQLSGEITQLGNTCPSQELSCAFTRTVVAVPEPGTYALMGLGMLGIGWRLRRRHHR